MKLIQHIVNYFHFFRSWIKKNERVFCPEPFYKVRINTKSEVKLCCGSWLPTPAGKVTDSVDFYNDIWNSKTAQNIRKSILDNSFKYCRKDKCPRLRSNNLPKISDIEDPYFREIIDKNLTVINKWPKVIAMNYDRSCNLSCPQCRPHIIQNKGKEKERIEQIHKYVLEYCIDSADELIITGAGDAFGSPLFRKFLQTYDFDKYKKIILRHNGTLLDENLWNTLKIHENPVEMWISIDAATKQTFEMLRRGGKWNKLLEVMDFCKKLRKKNKICYLKLIFSYNKINYCEMPAFVDLSYEWAADMINFMPLYPSAEFKGDKYNELNIFDINHSEHNSLMSVLKRVQSKTDKAIINAPED